MRRRKTAQSVLEYVIILAAIAAGIAAAGPFIQQRVTNSAVNAAGMLPGSGN